MPNAPKTPTRTVRVSDELWTAAQAAAAKKGVTVTSVMLDALKAFVLDSGYEELADNWE